MFDKFPRINSLVALGLCPLLVLEELADVLYRCSASVFRDLNVGDVGEAKAQLCAFALLNRMEAIVSHYLSCSIDDVPGTLGCFHGARSEESAFLALKYFATHEGGSIFSSDKMRLNQTLLDWIRGFLKECSDYFLLKEGRTEFESDVLFRWYMMSEKVQGELPAALSESEKIQTSQAMPKLWVRMRNNVIDNLKVKTLFHNLQETSGLLVEVRSYEVWMEILTACGCMLSLLGRSHHDGWARVLELSTNRTQGLPGGVCSYKATGDQYRKISRLVRDGDRRVRDGGASGFWIVQVLRDSIFFKEDNNQSDLTGRSLRLVGSAYCFFQYCVSLTTLSESNSGMRVLHLFSAEIDLTLMQGPFLGYLRVRELFRDVLVSASIDPNGLPISGCALGIDEGVYSIFASASSVPYTMRQVSDDTLRSIRNGVLAVRRQEVV